MVKNYNTPEYREAKRITAFIAPDTKKKIVMHSKKNKTSISKVVSDILDIFYAKVKV